MNVSDKYKKCAFFVTGVTFLTIAVVGVVLPGVPTTGPLLAACFFFAKVDPRLNDKILQIPVIGKFISARTRRSYFSVRAVIASMISMWGGIGLGIVMLLSLSPEAVCLPWIMVASGLIGTFCIAREAYKSNLVTNFCLHRPANSYSHGLDLGNSLYMEPTKVG